MDSQLYRLLSVVFKNKNLKHWLRVVPKFKVNRAKTFTSLESGIRNDGGSAKDPPALTVLIRLCPNARPEERTKAKLTVISENLQIYLTLLAQVIN